MRTLVISLALSTAAWADVSTWSTEFTASDGKTYLKEYVQDNETGSTNETLSVRTDAGTWQFVASLYSDGATGNWTGRIGDQFYADQYDETTGDWVVVIGASTWPTWTDFDAALAAIHFWDDGVYYTDVIAIDGVPILLDTMIVMALSTSGQPQQVSTTPARPGQKGLMTALSKAQNASARVALLTALNNPTPHDVFPALAKSGNRSPRARGRSH